MDLKIRGNKSSRSMPNYKNKQACDKDRIEALENASLSFFQTSGSEIQNW
jgi:hypothetical protein